MTEQDRPGFAELMLGIGETYGEPVSDARMEIYFKALSDLELADVRIAASVHVRLSKFFPRPAEIREAVGGSVDDRAEMAWMEVQRLVRRYGYPGIDGKGMAPDFNDGATRRAALELYGGWHALCSSLPADGPELLGYRKQFLATYRAYDNRNQRHEIEAGDQSRELNREEARAALESVMARIGKS